MHPFIRQVANHQPKIKCARTNFAAVGDVMGKHIEPTLQREVQMRFGISSTFARKRRQQNPWRKNYFWTVAVEYRNRIKTAGQRQHSLRNGYTLVCHISRGFAI